MSEVRISPAFVQRATETQRVAGGVPFSSLVIVTADQESILGDGTYLDPLRISSDGLGPQFFFVPDLPLLPKLGMPVSFTDSTNSAVAPSSAGSLGRPQTIGLILDIDDVSSPPFTLVRTRRSGIMTLTLAQWNLVTDVPGGLIQGAPYYLSTVSIGTISATKPTVSGDYITQVGVARDQTTLLLGRLPAFPTGVP